MVHSDGVGAQLGHAHDIALALGSVDKGIVGSQLISDAWYIVLLATRIPWGNAIRVLPKRTLQVVLCAILIEELGSDRGNGWNGAHRRSLEAGQQQRDRRERERGQHDQFSMIRYVGNGWMGIFIDRNARRKSVRMIENAKGKRMKCCAGQRGSRGQLLIAFAGKGKNHLKRLVCKSKSTKRKRGKKSNRDRSWQELDEYLDLRPWQSGVR